MMSVINARLSHLTHEFYNCKYEKSNSYFFINETTYKRYRSQEETSHTKHKTYSSYKKSHCPPTLYFEKRPKIYFHRQKTHIVVQRFPRSLQLYQNMSSVQYCCARVRFTRFCACAITADLRFQSDGLDFIQSKSSLKTIGNCCG